MKTTPIPYSHPVPVATLHGETHLVLTPDDAERARMAAALGLHALDALVARLKVTHAANGLVTLEGTLEASARPVCVVSLEPFPQAISTPVEVRLAPPGLIERMSARAQDNGDEDFEPPDEIIDGVIDFGALVTEFLALSLDPYPRKPGAAFAGLSEGEPPASPFAALEALRKP